MVSSTIGELRSQSVQALGLSWKIDIHEQLEYCLILVR